MCGTSLSGNFRNLNFSCDQREGSTCTQHGSLFLLHLGERCRGECFFLLFPTCSYQVPKRFLKMFPVAPHLLLDMFSPKLSLFPMYMHLKVVVHKLWISEKICTPFSNRNLYFGEPAKLQLFFFSLPFDVLIKMAHCKQKKLKKLGKKTFEVERHSL
jgi:hypothetical protein